MQHTRKLLRVFAVAFTVTAVLAFVFSRVDVEAAHVRQLSSGLDPSIQAIEVTATLPISDTQLGDGISKTVYLGNTTIGVTSLTFEISGTPEMTLTAGPAFGDVAQVFTSLTPTWSPALTYGVEASDGSYPNAGNSQLASVTVTVDTDAPTTTVPVPSQAPWITSTVGYTWLASPDSVSCTLNITNTDGYTQVFVSNQPLLTFTQAFSQGAGYYARVRAKDGLGNWGNWSGPSTVVTPDLTPPTLTFPSITAPPEFFFVAPSGVSLYYTNTFTQTDLFTVKGNAVDSLSGLDKATFSLAFGQTSTDMTPGIFSAHYDVVPGAVENGIITATVYDHVGNASVQTYTYALDDMPPQSNVTAPTSPVYGVGPFPLNWSATDSGSGVYSITLLYKKTGGNWQVYTDTTVSGEVTGTFAFAAPDDLFTHPVITYSFVTVAKDNLGNLEALPMTPGAQLIVRLSTIYLPIVFDTFPPPPSGRIMIDNDRTYTYRRTVPLQLIDTTVGDVISQVRLRNDGEAWGAWRSFTSTIPFTLSTGNGLKIVYAQFKGTLGGESPEVSDSILLFENGDFANGLWGWQVNGGLGASSAADPDDSSNPVGLIGSPMWQCTNGVPLDFSSLSQSIKIPQPSVGQSVKLKFRYRILTHDRNRTLGDQFDSFDVLVNGALAYRDANTALAEGCSSLHDLGWKSGEYTFTDAHYGQTVQISFAVYNRGDKYYNTYVYVDDVQVVFESLSDIY